jgi:hypothetical protein
MNNELIIKGMYCDACSMLIKMEIEENGFGDNVTSIEIVEGQNQGKVILQDVSEQDQNKIKNLINEMEKYEVQ